ASSADRARYQAGQATSTDPKTDGFSEADGRELKQLLAKRAELETRLKELTVAPMVYAGKLVEKPDPIHRLQRGDPMQPREVVEPGALSVLALPFRSSVAEDAGSHGATRTLTEDQQRRLALTEWIANPSNPLPARVIVNRL